MFGVVVFTIHQCIQILTQLLYCTVHTIYCKRAQNQAAHECVRVFEGIQHQTGPDQQ